MPWRLDSIWCIIWGFLWPTSWLALPAAAQYPVLPPLTNVTTVRSPVDGNITVSYKSPPPGTCTTVFANQTQFTGYVTLPPYTLSPVQQNFTINTFFWFVEARSNASTAPLTVWITGGPGSSSMAAFFQEVGPCEVVELGRNQLGTQARDWGWDRSSNLLFIDQPVDAGFSYSELANATMDLVTGNIQSPPHAPPAGTSLSGQMNGTFPSTQSWSTTNTSIVAGHAVWHMIQGFLGALPQYNSGSRANDTRTSSRLGVNLFAESYGGIFGPVFARIWEEKNSQRRNGTIAVASTVDVHLTSLGIMQGCIDMLVQGKYFPIFAYNNTYNIQALSLVDEQTAANDFLSADGCQGQIRACRNAVQAIDPNNNGDIDSVNHICNNAVLNCQNNVIGPYSASNRSVYDITQTTPDPFPSSLHLEYLNSAEVQQALGVRVNFTETSRAVSTAFLATGDLDRNDAVADLAYLLSQGIRVALIYGDRDYACNWLGGEAASFAVAAQSSSLAPFFSAGYADIVTNDSYVGGVVRQYGNLSFSRIYGAGHMIPAYQPETAFTVFTRVIMGTDISTGESVDLSSYLSSGKANATYQNHMPPSDTAQCFVRNAADSCSVDQQDAIKNGTGTIINGVWYSAASDWPAPAPSVTARAGKPGSLPPSMTATSNMTFGPSQGASSTATVPTGVFIATATPSMNVARPLDIPWTITGILMGMAMAWEQII